MSLRTLFLSAVALMTLAACEMREPDRIPETQNPTTLRAYTVPADRAEQMRDALNSVLGKKGSASRAGSDKILVLAPAILQSSVSETIKVLVKDVPPPAAEAGPVKLQVWVVDVSETAVTDPRLQALQVPLDAIRTSLGAPGFDLHAQYLINASARDRDHATTDDRGNVIARLTAVEGGVEADLTVTAGNMRSSSSTRLKYGETVVLAQATPGEGGRSRIRLVLVRADPAG